MVPTAVLLSATVVLPGSLGVVTLVGDSGSLPVVVEVSPTVDSGKVVWVSVGSWIVEVEVSSLGLSPPGVVLKLHFMPAVLSVAP